MDFFLWLSESSLGMGISQSVVVYPAILALHTVGLGFLVGTSVAVDLRILGLAPGVPLARMERFFKVILLGLWVNVLSGILLFVAGADKMGPNWLYWVKMLLVLIGAVTIFMIRKRVFGDLHAVNANPLPAGARNLAWASLIVWAMAITAGRFTAYIGNPL
jgi:hypothetical protein